MLGHGGNRTYDLWNTSPMLRQLSYAVKSARACDTSELAWIYTQSNITNIIFTRVHNTNSEKIILGELCFETAKTLGLLDFTKFGFTKFY